MFVIVLMDNASIADHNLPDTEIAATFEEAESKVREHIIANYWNINMDNCGADGLTDEEVRAMPMDELEEAFMGECCDEGYEWSIQEKV